MTHDWMLDVLEDLKSFASKHDLVRLAAHLDDTLHVAETDLAKMESVSEVAEGNEQRFAGVYKARRTC